MQRFPYGGQAVFEGVMMRGVRQATVAVRAPNGQLVLHDELLDTPRRHIWARLPFLCGVLVLWDALNLGVRALNFAARVAAGEATPMSSAASAGTLAVSLLFAFGLFFVLPLLLAQLVSTFGGSTLTREICEGGLRLATLLSSHVSAGFRCGYACSHASCSFQWLRRSPTSCCGSRRHTMNAAGCAR